MPLAFYRRSRSQSKGLRESIRSFSRASRSLNDVQTSSLDRRPSRRRLSTSRVDRVRSASDATPEVRSSSFDDAAKLPGWCCCDAAHAASLFFVHSQNIIVSRSEPSPFHRTTPLPPHVGRMTRTALRQPDRASFLEREVEVVADSTGFGFTVSGGAPAFVFSVDALGPASRAGLRVGDFFLNVNGFDVLDSSHREVTKLCLQGPSKAYIIVLSPPEFETKSPEPGEEKKKSARPLAVVRGGKATTGLLQLKRSISRSLGSLVKDNALETSA